jgi:hypothetical protein
MVRMFFGHIVTKTHHSHTEGMPVLFILVDGMFLVLIEELHMVVRELHVVLMEREVLNMVLIIFPYFAIGTLIWADGIW